MNEEKLTSKHFEKMFESIPTVSMKAFSSLLKENKFECLYKRVAFS